MRSAAEVVVDAFFIGVHATASGEAPPYYATLRQAGLRERSAVESLATHIWRSIDVGSSSSSTPSDYDAHCDAQLRGTVDAARRQMAEELREKVLQCENLEQVVQCAENAIRRLRDSAWARRCGHCGVSGSQKALQRCARCKSVAYCGREHQVLDYRTQHKARCQPATPEELERGLLGFTLTKRFPQMPSNTLPFHYASSFDGVDRYLLVCLHGNLDNEKNWFRVCHKMELLMTALVSIRAPLPAGMSGNFWYPDYGYTRGVPHAGDPQRMKPAIEGAEVVVQMLRVAMKEGGWRAEDVFLFGHGQGGTIAVEVARRIGQTLGAVVASGECALEEMIGIDKPETEVKKQTLALGAGQQVHFQGLHLKLAESRLVAEGASEWIYRLEWASDVSSKSGDKSVRFDCAIFDNKSSKGKKVSLDGERYTLTLTERKRESVQVSVEAVVEVKKAQIETPVLYTHGALDTNYPTEVARSKATFLRKKFRTAVHNEYKERKNVLGSDKQELLDVYAWIERWMSRRP